jgi:hypothetical protein
MLLSKGDGGSRCPRGCLLPERRSLHLPKAVGRRDAADLPLAGVDRVVRAVLVDAGAKTGRVEL